MPRIIWAGQSGCLLPLLIIFNLFFGKLFFHSTAIWLGIEGVLIFLFILKIHLFVRKISRQSHRPQGRGLPSARQSHRGRVIDVEGKVVEEKEKLK